MANVALFSFVNALLLQRIEVPDASRLVLFKNDSEQAILSYDELNELNKNAKTVTGVAGTFAAVGSLLLSDQPEWITTELVTGEYFSVVGVTPLIGSVVQQSDLDRAAGDPVCVVSFDFWRGRLGSRNDVLGRRVFINTHRYRIIGVLPQRFRGTNLQRPTDFFLPVTRVADFLPAFSGVPHFDWRKRLYFFPTFARLETGATALAASSELSRINKEYLGAAGRGDRKAQLEAADGSRGVDGGSGLGRPATILLAIAGVVLHDCVRQSGDTPAFANLRTFSGVCHQAGDRSFEKADCHTGVD